MNWAGYNEALIVDKQMTLSIADEKRVADLLETIKKKSADFLGYPVAKDFNFSRLQDFLHYPMNNLGDPFSESTWKVDSRLFEQEVITFMADLFRAPKDNFWGYVTNGGSEGNLYGLYLARELYPRGIVYFSKETHYSVSKNIHLLNMRHIMIQTLKNGEIDYEDLKETIRINRDKPAVIFANIGTTMTEAKDDIKKIRQILDDLVITDFYIHSDAALAGGIAPFLDPRPPFDFTDGADSISVSGHKSFGSPIPCGVVIAKKNNVSRIARSISYIGSLDTTITGSRNGLTPLFLWYTIKKLGKEGLKDRINKALILADYTLTQLKGRGIAAWKNPGALTIVFPKAPEAVQEKWQLATADGQSHIIVMPHVNREQIDLFITDLVQSDL